MRETSSGPKWWPLLLLVPLAGGLFAVEVNMRLTEPEHHFAEVVILVAVYTVIELWLRRNAGAMARDDAEKRRSPFA
jgi:hypothetical protein